MKRIPLTFLLSGTVALTCHARTSELVSPGEGIGPYNGWVVADMSMEDGVVSPAAAYSMRTFKDYGLVPVAYCSSGGSHLGTYYTFFVNPYSDSLIVGRTGTASHSAYLTSNLGSYSESGKLFRATDMGPNQDLYRKIIRVGKTEFSKYQNMIK